MIEDDVLDVVEPENTRTVTRLTEPTMLHYGQQDFQMPAEENISFDNWIVGFTMVDPSLAVPLFSFIFKDDNMSDPLQYQYNQKEIKIQDQTAEVKNIKIFYDSANNFYGFQFYDSNNKCILNAQPNALLFI